MMVVDVLRPVMCIWWAKWAERPPKVMKRSQLLNTLQICPRRDSNSGGSNMWSNALDFSQERQLITSSRVEIIISLINTVSEYLYSLHL